MTDPYKRNINGTCPECGRPGVNRIRHINDYVECAAGHKWEGRTFEDYCLEMAERREIALKMGSGYLK